jgi:hypothetical protein
MALVPADGLQLVEAGTERTTAATDLVLALVAWSGRRYLRRRTPASERRRAWLTALGCFGLAAALGAVTHGMVMPEGLRDVLWQPLYLLLGAAVALFVVGAVGDWRGSAAARRVQPAMLAAAVLFYLGTLLAGGEFLVFVVFEVAALGFATVLYLWLAVARRVRGAGIVAAALALSLAAGAVQASPALSARLVWEFDHNGLYHLIQLVGLLLLVLGLRATLQLPTTTP